jgi:hypothetical protein
MSKKTEGASLIEVHSIVKEISLAASQLLEVDGQDIMLVRDFLHSGIVLEFIEGNDREASEKKVPSCPRGEVAECPSCDRIRSSATG